MTGDSSSHVCISVVIPGRDCAETLPACIRALRRVQSLNPDRAMEIVFVDDESTDSSASVAEAEGARTLAGDGRGPGAARNKGWRAARGDLIWFVDSDCEVAEASLGPLLAQLDDPKVGAVGGACDNGCPGSLVAQLIHEEIALRHHRSMQGEVNFLASFSVIYRRDVLEQLSGFDERYLKGQDAELSFRTLAQPDTGFRFENASASRTSTSAGSSAT